jgi:hypothetical protein
MGPRLLMPLLAGAILAVGLWSTGGKMSAEPPDGPPGAKGKGPPHEKGGPGEKGGPPGKAGHDLRHAYEVLNDVSVRITQGKDVLPAGTAKLFDDSKEIYRSALKSFKDDDRERASEMAKAANDAARGLKHVVNASLPAATDLPAPPEGYDGPPPPPREGRRGRGPDARDDSDGPPPPPRQGPRAKGRPTQPDDEEDAPPPPPREDRGKKGPPREDDADGLPPPPDGGPRAKGRPAPPDEEEDAPPPPPRAGRPGKGPPPPPDGDDAPPPPRRGGRENGPQPGPPPGGPRAEAASPKEFAREAMHRAKRRLDEAGEATGVGKEFLDGARNAYSLAKKSFADGDYRKSAELAQGADAWTHVSEHLQDGGFGGASLRSNRDSEPPPPPDGRQKGRRPPPPRDDDDGPGGRPPLQRDNGPDGRRPPPPPDGE